MIKWISILLAVAGLALGLVVVLTSSTRPPEIDPAQLPSINPFPAGIAATGMVEAAGGNIQLSAPEPGMVTDVYVQVNDAVTTGQALFKLDTRALEAERLRVVAARQVAQSQLDRLKAAPRPEDVAPLAAAVDQAKAQFEDARSELERAQAVYESRAAGSAEVMHRQNAMLVAKAMLDQAQAQHDRVAAGAWKPELDVAAALLAEAQAAVKSIDTRIERLTVRSPIDGVVLRREVEPGEFLGLASPIPAMVVGDMTTLHVRAQVDEEDAAQIVSGSEAVGLVRGLHRQKVALTQIRIEPMAVPKRQLTNSPMELIDTRVVQVVYAVDDNAAVRLFPGQLIDVFIETK